MYLLEVQFADKKEPCPKASTLKKWATTVLERQKISTAEITIRIVSIDEMSELNFNYRQKKGPTNVLSFPFILPDSAGDVDTPVLGDIVICSAVVNREAREQEKTADAHWAHMVVHGIYHILGFDHENDVEAEVMEGLETDTMRAMNFPDPYDIGEDIKNYD